jgi:hypothetical protein
MADDRLTTALDDPALLPPYRQIRAVYTDTTITVYQAYSGQIAEHALQAQRFVPPFQISRMTWIKPSFLWMMYRSGWGTKDGQERVLAIDITRSGFQWCLENACLSHFDPAIHASETAWQKAKEQSPVRVQWDPERSIRLVRLDYRSIQIGLSGPAVAKYVGDWIVHVRDVTSLAHEIHGLVDAGAVKTAENLLPQEVHYPAVASHLGLAS